MSCVKADSDTPSGAHNLESKLLYRQLPLSVAAQYKLGDVNAYVNYTLLLLLFYLWKERIE
jgi:hypothetical protein